VLLFVRRALLIGDVTVIRTLGADGSELSRVALRDSDLVSAKPLPLPWTNSSGPWGADVADVLSWSQDPRAGGYMAVWTTVKGSEKADRIEVGLVDSAKNEQEAADLSRKMGLVPPYYLAAFDMLSFAEVTRASSEQTEILHEREVLTQILGPGPTDDAYLVPDKLYKVTATWNGVRQSDNAPASATQTFWFRTDAAAPARLDPWVLLTNPSDGEGHAFRLEPVQIVFNTHNVDRLFGAYGKELRVRFTASSAHHPQSTPAVPHPFPLNAQSLKPAGSAILSPWEQALQDVVSEDGLACIAVDGNRVRQSETTIQIPLDPFTDYRMDVVMVDAGAPQNADGTRIYRRSFSTGAYDTLKHFASDIQASSITHRGVAAGGMEAIRTFFNGRAPEGAELDEQLRAAGIDAPEHAPGARALLIWEQTGTNPPQPAAILVDAPEPLWRSRPYPRKVTDTSGPNDATRWVLGDRTWLELQSGAGSDAVIAANGFIRAPGDQRVLIVLGPGNRGKTLHLDLVRTANTDPYLPIAEERYTVIDVVLVKAPWEE
jgi:large repetitive protein